LTSRLVEQSEGDAQADDRGDIDQRRQPISEFVEVTGRNAAPITFLQLSGLALYSR
jgi:hypothetical protein